MYNPVSYTHLDVYKRQYFDLFPQTFQRGIRTSVSYTHLDVYKRQELVFSDVLQLLIENRNFMQN